VGATPVRPGPGKRVRQLEKTVQALQRKLKT
jgi:hypothetical protein